MNMEHITIKSLCRMFFLGIGADFCNDHGDVGANLKLLVHVALAACEAAWQYKALPHTSARCCVIRIACIHNASVQVCAQRVLILPYPT